MPTSRYVSQKPKYQKHGHLSQPPKKSAAVFEWETFVPLADYTDSSMVEVFKRISRDVIERPYHYDKHKVFNIDGKTFQYQFECSDNVSPPAKVTGVAVYKQNHGTGHAIRQMIYTGNLLGKLLMHGSENGREIAHIIDGSPEISSLIKLAAYCKRIGRTLDHEKDHNTPTIYSKRSSDIFAKMAEELGYSKDLIMVISDSMLEPRSLLPEQLKDKTFNGISALDLRNFSESILMAAHMADLVRLSKVKRDYIISALSEYVEIEQLLPVATELVEMACISNEITGNRVVAQEFGVKHDTAVLNGQKLVLVVNNITATVDQLNSLFNAPLPSQPAAQAPLNNLEKQQAQIDALLVTLNTKAEALEKKSKKNPKRYGLVASEIRQLHTTLTKEKKVFFKIRLKLS